MFSTEITVFSENAGPFSLPHFLSPGPRTKNGPNTGLHISLAKLAALLEC